MEFILPAHWEQHWPFFRTVVLQSKVGQIWEKHVTRPLSQLQLWQSSVFHMSPWLNTLPNDVTHELRFTEVKVGSHWPVPSVKQTGKVWVMGKHTMKIICIHGQAETKRKVALGRELRSLSSLPLPFFSAPFCLPPFHASHFPLSLVSIFIPLSYQFSSLLSLFFYASNFPPSFPFSFFPAFHFPPSLLSIVIPPSLLLPLSLPSPLPLLSMLSIPYALPLFQWLVLPDLGDVPRREVQGLDSHQERAALSNCQPTQDVLRQLQVTQRRRTQ